MGTSLAERLGNEYGETSRTNTGKMAAKRKSDAPRRESKVEVPMSSPRTCNRQAPQTVGYNGI